MINDPCLSVFVRFDFKPLILVLTCLADHVPYQLATLHCTPLLCDLIENYILPTVNLFSVKPILVVKWSSCSRSKILMTLIKGLNSEMNIAMQ